MIEFIFFYYSSRGINLCPGSGPCSGFHFRIFRFRNPARPIPAPHSSKPILIYGEKLNWKTATNLSRNVPEPPLIRPKSNPSETAFIGHLTFSGMRLLRDGSTVVGTSVGWKSPSSQSGALPSSFHDYTKYERQRQLKLSSRSF